MEARRVSKGCWSSGALVRSEELLQGVEPKISRSAPLSVTKVGLARC